jgi:polysaccharide lyase family 4-like protein/rhamnogalacturonate lyase-like protein
VTKRIEPTARALRLIVFLACLALAQHGTANVPGGGTNGPAVSLTRNGNLVTLANGIVTATIETTGARVTSLRYKGQEMVSQRGRHKTIYFFVVGDRDYEIASPCVYSVTQQTPDTIDISCKRTYSRQNTNQHPWDLDTHFVLRRGASGLYVYSIATHPASYPELNIGQYLMIWSMPYATGNTLLEKIYVDDARHWELPAPEDFGPDSKTGIEEIARLNRGIWKDRYDCKYMYNAEYWTLGCWGFASDRNRIGAWVVFGSHEYFNDGPTMSDLTSATGLLHVMFNMNHYNGTALKIPKGEAWQKIYGPLLLYCNSGPDGDACWADAKRQADAEKAAWPYDWVKNSGVHPPKQARGAIAGRFLVQDSLKPALNGGLAWIGLAQPEPNGNWQHDSKGYQYWTRTDSRGTFLLPNVRPGNYTLYAFKDGAVGEFSHADIKVTAGDVSALGDLVWAVPHSGTKIAWEIGVPDRTAKEFRHGDDYFQPLLWDKFPGEFSNPHEYTVGVSDWSKDWNYVHCGYPVGEKWSPWKWRIHFNLSDPPKTGDATLTIAYASSYWGRTELYVNGETKLFCPIIHPSEDGGNALIREGIHAKYSTQQISIPMSALKKGNNTFTLIQGGNRFDRAFYHVMYDYLNLELPAGQ